jgi:hypothetical protein
MVGRRLGIVAGALVAILTSAAFVSAQDQTPTKEGVAQRFDRPAFSPYAGRSYPTKVLWGDTHLHTAVSVDAGTMCRLGQEEAFRFARELTRADRRAAGRKASIVILRREDGPTFVV